MKEEPSRPDNEKKLSRRELLVGAAVVGAPVALGGGLLISQMLKPGPDKYEQYLFARSRRMHLDGLSKLPAEKREGIIDGEVARVREFILGSEGARILESGTDDELWSLITMLPPILRDDIRGTRFDADSRAWPSMVMAPSNTATPKTLDLATVNQDRPKEYANGFYIGRDDFVTNHHTIAGFTKDIPREDALRIDRMRLVSGLDIVHVQMPEIRTANVATKILPIPDNANSGHCQFVTIAGIDPDETADRDGTKLYPSMAIRVTPRLAALFDEDTAKADFYGKSLLERYINSYMIVLPPGETESSLNGRKPLPVRGMSGSPVLSAGALAGIFSFTLNGYRRHGGILYNIGFFHGLDQIKKARDLGMSYKAPN